MIGGSPHAPPRAAAGWVLRRSWSATVSGSAAVSRWQRAWSAALSRTVGMLYRLLAAAGQEYGDEPEHAEQGEGGRTRPRPRPGHCETESGRGQMWTTGQVRVRVMPSRFCTFETTQLAELVDVAGLGAHDHVVRAGDVLGQGHALDLGDLARHLRGLAHVGLDEDVRLDDHGLSPPRRWSGGRGVVRDPCRAQPPRSTSWSTGRSAGDGVRRSAVWWDEPMSFPADATVSEVGEFPLIARLREVFAQGEQVLVGPGDDAAVLRIRNGHVVVSTDVLVEGRHFRREWASAADIGHRAAAANLSDINAMGGRAHSLTIGLAAPRDLPASWALEFAQGFAEECAPGRRERRRRRPDLGRLAGDRGDRARVVHAVAGAPLGRRAG